MYYHKPTSLMTLSTGWVGPYVVTSKLNAVDYEIRDSPGGKPLHVHVDFLMECRPNRGVPNWMTGRPNPGPKVFEHKNVQTLPMEQSKKSATQAKKRQVKPKGPASKQAGQRRPPPKRGSDKPRAPPRAKKGPDKGKAQSKPQQAAQEFLSKSDAPPTLAFRGFQTRNARKKKGPT